MKIKFIYITLSSQASFLLVKSINYSQSFSVPFEMALFLYPQAISTANVLFIMLLSFCVSHYASFGNIQNSEQHQNMYII